MNFGNRRKKEKKKQVPVWSFMLYEKLAGALSYKIRLKNGFHG